MKTFKYADLDFRNFTVQVISPYVRHISSQENNNLFTRGVEKTASGWHCFYVHISKKGQRPRDDLWSWCIFFHGGLDGTAFQTDIYIIFVDLMPCDVQQLELVVCTEFYLLLHHQRCEHTLPANSSGSKSSTVHVVFFFIYLFILHWYEPLKVMNRSDFKIVTLTSGKGVGVHKSKGWHPQWKLLVSHHQLWLFATLRGPLHSLSRCPFLF